MEHLITAFSLSQIPTLPIMERRHVNARIVIPVNIYTEKIRIRFSNRYGKQDGVIKHATVMLCDDHDKPIPKSCQEITVSQKQELHIPAGQEIASDPISFILQPGDRVAVSVYVEEKASTNGSVGYQVTRKTGKGDLSQTRFDGKRPSRLITKLLRQPPLNSIPYFRALDAYTEDSTRIVACLGDSITAQGRWTHPLAELLYRRYPGKICVLNHGICGNRLAADAAPSMPIFGESALKRMDFDVLKDHGVSDLIVALGLNDINMEEFSSDNGTRFLETFKNSLRELVHKAHDHSISVCALGVYPARFKEKEYEGKEGIRQAVNESLRQTCDRYVDLDAILKNPDGPGYREGFGYSDGVHLHRVAGDAIAEIIFNEVFS